MTVTYEHGTMPINNYYNNIIKMSEDTKTEETQKSEGNNLAIPIAIVIAGLVIAGAVIFSGNQAPAVPSENDVPEEVRALLDIREDDHIVGDPNSPIIIVEYSDTECPFCKMFHATMNQVIDVYGDGQVAWVYRQFPIASLHPNATKQAEATECVAKLGGNEAFWQFTNKIYEVTPSNNGLDMSLLPQFATEVGVDKAEFTACLDSGEMQEKIAQEIENVVTLGGQGTPHSFILFQDEVVVIPGAQEFESVAPVIDAMLEKI